MISLLAFIINVAFRRADARLIALLLLRGFTEPYREYENLSDRFMRNYTHKLIIIIIMQCTASHFHTMWYKTKSFLLTETAEIK